MESLYRWQVFNADKPKVRGPDKMGTQTSHSMFKSYLFFWSGQLISLLGSSVAQFVIIWWILLETGSPFYLSLAAFLGLVPMIVLAPITGVLADRVNRKVLIFTVDFMQAMATLAIIVLFWADIVSIWLVMLLLTARGVFQAFHQPVVIAIVPSMVPADKLSRMNGLNYLFTGAMSLIGPVIGAILLSFLPIYHVLWIDVITFAVAVIPLVLVAIPRVREEQIVSSSFQHDFREGLSFIRAKRGFFTLLILATMLNFLLTPLSTLLPYFVKFDHLGTVGDLALVTAFFEGGILAGGLLMTVIKGFKRKMVASGTAIYLIFLGYAIVAFTPTSLFWFMALGGLFTALCIPVANVSFQTITQTVVPLDMQGRVNSVTMALASAATPIGMILSGVIVQFIATANFFLFCVGAGVLILTAAWLFTDVRYVDQNEMEKPISY